jgi:putative spermidine/putrescine transport system permease protein
MSSAASAPAAAILPGRGGVGGALSDAFWRNPKLLLFVMLTPPLLWLGIIYLGSLFALLIQSFFSIDEFSGLVVRELTLKTYGELLRPSISTSLCAPSLMAALVTIASAIIAFPIAYFAARYARGRWKAVFYLGVMLPLVVELSGQGLCLEADPGQGRHPHLGLRQAAPDLSDRCLASLPVVGGNSLSLSLTGTFLVFSMSGCRS